MSKNKYRDKIPIGFSEVIEDFLYLGSGRDARDKTSLQEKKIENILNCATEWKNYNTAEFNFFNLNLRDEKDEDISKSFDEAYNFICNCEENQSKVLVHCVVGKSRSATIIIYFLMRRYKMSLVNSHSLVREKRPIIAPNPGFLNMLCETEINLFDIQYSTIDVSKFQNDWGVPLQQRIIQNTNKKQSIQWTEEMEQQLQNFLDQNLTDVILETYFQEFSKPKNFIENIEKLQKKDVSRFINFIKKEKQEIEIPKIFEKNQKFEKSFNETIRIFFFKRIV